MHRQPPKKKRLIKKEEQPDFYESDAQNIPIDHEVSVDTTQKPQETSTSQPQENSISTTLTGEEPTISSSIGKGSNETSTSNSTTSLDINSTSTPPPMDNSTNNSAHSEKSTNFRSGPMEETKEEDNKKHEPRLVMKKMVLNDFKSYAGRQVIGPFHKV